MAAWSRIVRRCREAVIWDRALQASVAGRHNEALGLLRSVGAQGVAPRHWRVAEIFELWCDGQSTLALDAAQSFLAADWIVLTPDEQYLQCFVQWVGWVAFDGLFPGLPKPESLEPAYEKVRLQAVRKRWKRTFPLTMHPAWSDDQPRRR